MKILITNDDGIYADGIVRLAKVAREFGEVWIIAPEKEKSAASHSITLRHALDVYPVNDFPADGVRAYSCSGTPADCVRVGSLGVMPEKPGIVISGINKGYNMASDIQYSATAGSAFEAAFQGYHPISVSEGFGDMHEVTDRYLTEVLDKVINSPIPRGYIHNINFPGCPLAECRGILYDRKVSPGMYFSDTYDRIEELENGGVRYMIHGTPTMTAEEGSDFRAVLDNYVSVGLVNNIGY